MKMLLPDQVKELWQQREHHNRSEEACYMEQEQLIEKYRTIWHNALCLGTHDQLEESILWELGQYTQCQDLAEIRTRCQQAVASLKAEWQDTVIEGDRSSIEQFYDESHAAILELMWWHTLLDDSSPLAYVTALEFAQQHGCRDYLDFGAGVGSGGILFSHYGLGVTLSDISSTLQQFSHWRLTQRNISAQYIDLKVQPLPSKTFDIVTAMDVFEHLVDPIEAVEQLADALRPGGFFFARLASEVDEDRPQHIIQDFAPTFNHLKKLGFTQVWQDDWLWGHVVFQKP